MGLNDNTKNIELALNEKNKIQKEKEREKQLARIKKENDERLKYDVIEAIKITFDDVINNNEDLQQYYFNYNYYTLLNNIIKEYSNTKEVQNMATGKTKILYLQQDKIKEIFEQNYFKILKQKETLLNKRQKILIEHEKEKQQILQELRKKEEAERIQKEQEEEQKNQRTLLILKTLAYIIIGIICLPVGFCLLLVFAACKNSK